MGRTAESKEIVRKIALLRMSKGVIDGCLRDLKQDGITEHYRRLLIRTAQHEYARMKRTAAELREYQRQGKLGTYTAAIR